MKTRTSPYFMGTICLLASFGVPLNHIFDTKPIPPPPKWHTEHPPYNNPSKWTNHERIYYGVSMTIEKAHKRFAGRGEDPNKFTWVKLSEDKWSFMAPPPAACIDPESGALTYFRPNETLPNWIPGCLPSRGSTQEEQMAIRWFNRHENPPKDAKELAEYAASLPPALTNWTTPEAYDPEAYDIGPHGEDLRWRYIYEPAFKIERRTNGNYIMESRDIKTIPNFQVTSNGWKLTIEVEKDTK